MIIQFFIFIFLFVFGASVASFLVSVVSSKNALSIFSRSKCDHCSVSLKFYNLIPILSYLFQMGKCSFCRKSIKINYLIYEVILAISLPLAWFANIEQGLITQIIMCIIIMSFCFTIYLDWEKMLISLPVIGVILVSTFLLYLINESYNYDLLLSKLFGLIVGFLTLWGINRIYFMVRKKIGIGEGDPILFAVIGFFIGIEFLFYILIFSSITGAIYGIILIKYFNGSTLDRIPFGSFLSFSTIILYFYKALYF